MARPTQQSTTINPEWPRRIDVSEIGTNPYKSSISATELERKDVARRLKLDSINFLAADYVLQREAGSNIIHVSGTVNATVVQPCVISLEKIEEKISEDFESWYADESQAVSLARVRQDRISRLVDSEVPVLEEKEDPEAVIDGKIDLGELAVQFLSLAVSPFPRAEGSVKASTAPVGGPEGEVYASAGEETTGPRRNPFAALKNWKKGRETGSDEEKK